MHLIAKATRKSRAKFISIDLAFGMVASLDGLLHLVYLPFCNILSYNCTRYSRLRESYFLGTQCIKIMLLLLL